MTWLRRDLIIVLVLAGVGAVTDARAQQSPAKPEASLYDALSAACKQDADAFANSLTSDNATAYRALPGPQRTAILKRFVQLEDPGRPLLSTSVTGEAVLRCET